MQVFDKPLEQVSRESDDRMGADAATISRSAARKVRLAPSHEAPAISMAATSETAAAVSDLRANVAHNLRALRMRRSMTQGELAGAAGLSRQFLCGIEAGRFGVTLETLEALARGLHVEASTLIRPLKPVSAEVDFRELRERQGLSQSELAILSGVSRVYINKVERGRVAPGRKARKALARALRVSPALLVDVTPQLTT